jgi:chromosome segregation ATPase
MIKIKDDQDKKEIKFEAAIRKLNEEKDEMRFLLSQKDIQIKNAEQETDSIRRKLNEILQKVYGDYNNQGLAGAEKLLKTGTTKPMNIIGRKTEFFIPNALDNQMNAETAFKSLNNNLSEKEEWARDLREADERALKFRNDTKVAEQRSKDLQQRIEILEKQIQSRDLEIKRMGDNYFLSDNLEEIKVKYQSEHMQKTIDKLNLQIDFLNSRNHELEESHKFHETKCNGKTIRILEKEIEKINLENKDKKTRVAQLERKITDYEKESKYVLQDKVFC